MKKLSLAVLTLMISAQAFSAADQESYNCTHKIHASLTTYRSPNPEKIQIEPQDMINFITKQKVGQISIPGEVMSFTEGDVVSKVKAASRNEAISKVLQECESRNKDQYLNGSVLITKPSNVELALYTGDIKILSHVKQHCLISNKDGVLAMSAQEWGKSEASNRKVFKTGQKKAIKDWKAMAKDEPELKDVAGKAIEIESKLTFEEYELEMESMLEKFSLEIRCEK